MYWSSKVKLIKTENWGFCLFVWGSESTAITNTELLSKPEHQEVCYKTFIPRNGHINKMGTMATSIHLLTWKGEKLSESKP